MKEKRRDGMERPTGVVFNRNTTIPMANWKEQVDYWGNLKIFRNTTVSMVEG